MTPRPKPATRPATKSAEPPKPDEFAVLESAANALVDAMPMEPVRQVLREAARAQHIPLWMLVCGLLQRCYDTGEQSAPVLDPLWLHAAPVTMGEYADVSCRCGQTFRPRWPGQEYCSESCGVAAYRDRVAADRLLVQQELATYPVGQEPPDRARSTIRQREDDGLGAETFELGGLPEREDPVAQIEADAQAEIQTGQ